jgi:nicotinate-nucleotide adenylyltransferase
MLWTGSLNGLSVASNIKGRIKSIHYCYKKLIKDTKDTVMAEKINRSIGILGGTFDPIHFGHLRMALTLLEKLSLNEIWFIPCKQPLLKETARAATSQRLKMLQIATHNQTGFIVDERELKRNTPSYSVDTLRSIRDEHPAASLCFIIGSDILSELTQWHRWQEILTLAHLIVVTRPGYQPPQSGEIAVYLKNHLAKDKNELLEKTHGCIWIQPLPLLEISSSDIRKQIMNGQHPRYLLPDEVLAYIHEEGIYKK